MAVNFHNEKLSFLPKNKTALKNWIKSVIILHGCKSGELNFIFTNDANLLEINSRFLHHDFLTDIITFDYTDEKGLSGDIYISMERVAENAPLYSKTLNDELKRVIIHGVLHLIGYKDKNKGDMSKMRGAEEKALLISQDLIIV